jgi:hypothetical protein
MLNQKKNAIPFLPLQENPPDQMPPADASHEQMIEEQRFKIILTG